jgi:hypothetical protein
LGLTPQSLGQLLSRAASVASAVNDTSERSASRAAVVVGEYGVVNRCRIPFSTQIRSNNTSRDADIARSLPAVNRPVTPSR